MNNNEDENDLGWVAQAFIIVAFACGVWWFFPHINESIEKESYLEVLVFIFILPIIATQIAIAMKTELKLKDIIRDQKSSLKRLLQKNAGLKKQANERRQLDQKLPRRGVLRTIRPLNRENQDN